MSDKMSDSRKRKKSDSSNAERSKRKANRVGKKGDDEIIATFMEMMESPDTMNTPAYCLALGQFLCCAARDVKSIQMLERLLDSTNLPETDSPSQCFVVEGVIRICVSIQID